MAIAEPLSLAALIRNIKAAPEQVYTDFKTIADSAFDATWCNCYAYIDQHFADLPASAVIRAGVVPTPAAHTVAVFYYAEVELHHYAYVTAVADGYVYLNEANYVSCTQGTRRVPLDDPSLLGFYHL